MFRYRLRTLLLLTLLGPPLLAGVLVYGERPYLSFLRWINRQPRASVRVISILPPTQQMPDEGNPNPQ
jgi:hypothetical protein